MRIKSIISGLLCCILISILSSSDVFTQQLEITLLSEKEEYTSEDSILISCTIENISYYPVTFIDIGSFSNPGYCWSVYDYGENLITGYDTERTLSDFKTLYPGEKITVKKTIAVFWLCRSAPKWKKEMNFNFNYNLEVTEKDNYYMTRDIDGDHKIRFDSWTGSVHSNDIVITIKREDYR